MCSQMGRKPGNPFPASEPSAAVAPSTPLMATSAISAAVHTIRFTPSVSWPNGDMATQSSIPRARPPEQTLKPALTGIWHPLVSSNLGPHRPTKQHWQQHKIQNKDRIIAIGPPAAIV